MNLEKQKFERQKSTNEQIQEIYTQFTDSEKKSLEQNTIKLDTLRKKLDLLKKTSKKSNEEIAKLQDEIFLLQREKVRLVQFFALKYKWNDKQKTIIWKNENPDTVRASDILFLKKTWADLAKLLLVKKWDTNKEVSRDKIEERDEFITNFWDNQNINHIIGAGDILPVTIREIEVNGKKWYRKSSPRPGYYTENGKYLPIYDGDNIKIIKKWIVNDDEMKESEKADIEQFERTRINDINDWLAWTELYEDKLLTEKAKTIKEEELKRFNSIKNIYKIDWTEWAEAISKKLKDLDFWETKKLLISIFWEWPWTNLIIKLDNWSTFMIKRMVALAFHEWWFKFWRRNPDPSSGFNIWTFQIWWSWSTEADSLRKYNNCLSYWVNMAEEKWIDVNFADLSNAQKDLLAHMWYIQTQRWWEETFEKLRNPNLNYSEVVELMSKKIQWWIKDIGRSVYSQMDYDVKIW